MEIFVLSLKWKFSNYIKIGNKVYYIVAKGMFEKLKNQLMN